MRNIGILALLLGTLCSPVLAAQAPAKGDQAGQQAEKSPQQQAMDQLAQAGIRESLKAIHESGGLYPFGLIQTGDKVQAIGYSGKKKDAPPEEQWAEHLFVKLRDIGKAQPEVDMMAMFRLHKIDNKDGSKTLGVWAEVDHRDVRPWVIFLPLVKNDDGKYELGKMVYYATEQGLFEEHAQEGQASDK
ncbi:hypothetical protein A11A3_09425 [Alcanivorax hongdengensis A-11-3]|uniref:Uncharacterized protein n=1 Tax=Alcanivorax hongdengensis A-11-3 TaxID=1177179 RepID=L0WB18_9GAMM|nr:hypothetical protein [Alcanivorax hongdengensis]EKF74209.1 hypothetical protein A11A3_09425 [Alcanivorax hongdengensis A-11-3]